MDTLKIIDSTVRENIHKFVIEQKNDQPWQVWFLILGIISLFLAVAVPYFQKKYEENKAKNTFKRYIKYYLNSIYGALVSYPIQYSLISKENVITNLSLDKSINNFKVDFKNFHETESSLIAYELIYNLQSILLGIYRTCLTIKGVDLNSLKEKTLAYGEKLSKRELNNIYAVIATLENLGNIAYFNDIFSKFKTIERILNEGIWVGINRVEDLTDEKTVFDELKYLKDHKNQIRDVLGMTELTIVQLEILFGHYKGKKIKVNKDTFKNYL